MEYLPPVAAQGQQSQQVDASGLPLLNLAAVSKDYYGAKAFEYDLGREDSEKWKAEYIAVQEGLKGLSGALLDVPCGTGRFFPIYRELGFRVLGLDISEDMLHQAHVKDDQVQLGTADLGKRLPIADKIADVTVCSQFLKFLTEPELAAVIRELGRVTKSRILCSLFTANQTVRGGKRNWVHALPVFNAAVEAAGFKIAASAPIEPRKGHHMWLCEAA
jgi:ubiquinone/menaquinone biosynthesis C-methylase UbiE